MQSKEVMKKLADNYETLVFVSKRYPSSMSRLKNLLMSEGVSETSARRKIADLDTEEGCLVVEMVLTHIDFLSNQCYSYINQMVNIRVVIYIKITYANSKVEKYFSDYRRMQKTLPAEWVRTIKKHIDRLRVCECFGDFLKLGLGRPEQLTGYKNIRYSLHVTPNVRLIIEPDATQETILICTTIEVEGVSDYHGSKDNWYIP